MGTRMTALVVAGALAAPVGAADLGELLFKVEAAYGGAGAVAAMSSYHAEGVTRSAMGGGEGRIARDYQAPDRLKVVIDYADRSELRLINGEAAWRGDRAGVRAVEGPMRASMEYQLLRSDLPGALLRYRDRLEDGGVVEHEGGSHQLLVLRWSSLVEMKYWVDSASFLVTHVESAVNMGAHSVVFATALDDFRKVDGGLFPFKETNYASGQHVADTQLEKVELAPATLGPFTPEQPVAPATTAKKPSEIEG